MEPKPVGYFRQLRTKYMCVLLYLKKDDDDRQKINHDMKPENPHGKYFSPTTSTNFSIKLLDLRKSLIFFFLSPQGVLFNHLKGCLRSTNFLHTDEAGEQTNVLKTPMSYANVY